MSNSDRKAEPRDPRPRPQEHQSDSNSVAAIRFRRSMHSRKLSAQKSNARQRARPTHLVEELGHIEHAALDDNPVRNGHNGAPQSINRQFGTNGTGDLAWEGEESPADQKLYIKTRSTRVGPRQHGSAPREARRNAPAIAFGVVARNFGGGELLRGHFGCGGWSARFGCAVPRERGGAGRWISDLAELRRGFGNYLFEM